MHPQATTGVGAEDSVKQNWCSSWQQVESGQGAVLSEAGDGVGANGM